MAMTGKRIQVSGGDLTLAEELHFIHSHIEAIDTSIDGINVALKTLSVTIQAIVDAINEEAIEPDAPNG